MNLKENQHNYGIDLLRIAAMLMIVAHHFSLHSAVAYDGGSVDGAIMTILALSGKTGCNIFVLITGYCSSGRIRKEKIVNLIAETTLYSFVLTVIAVLTGNAAISKKLLIKAVLPLLFGDTYWFMVTYLELYILIPILNQVIRNLTERTFRGYLALFTCLLCIIPTVADKAIHVNDLGFSTLVWFVYLYCLGAYLKKYKVVRPGALGIAAVCIAAQAAASLLLRGDLPGGVARMFLESVADTRLNAVFSLLIAAVMLLGFQGLSVTRGKKWVRIIAASTWGVYLFHDNVNFRTWLWSAAYRLATEIGLEWFAVNAILTVLLVFVTGSVVEICRKTAVIRTVELLRRKKNM